MQLKKFFVGGLSTLILLIGVPISAQTTSSSSPALPVSTSSASFQEIAAQARAARSDSQSIEHGNLRLDLGIRQRSSQSPGGYADINITGQQVLNDDFLEVYARHVMLTEPIREMSVGDENITMIIDGPAKLFGFIPADVLYEISVDFDGQIQDITVNYPGRMLWLYSKIPADELVAEIAADMNGKNYISTTQLRGLLIESMISALES